MYSSIAQRRIVAEREFSDLVDLSSSAGVLGFMGPAFEEAIQDALNASLTLEGVIISGPNGEYGFERQRGSILSPAGGTPRFREKFGVSLIPLSHIRIEGLRNVTISGAYRYIDYSLFITLLKRVLLAVLVALMTALLTLILQTILAKPEAETEDDHAVPDSRRKKTKKKTPAPEDTEASTLTEGFASDEGFALDEDFASDFDPFPLGTEEEPFTGEEVPGEEIISFEEPVSPAPDIHTAPRELYAPSGIGWEAYTLDRLTAELHRCASIEQDLVLMLMEYKNAGAMEGEIYTRLANTAVSFFNTQDLIFEKGERGLTVIVPTIDLEKGLAMAEDFQNHLPASFTAVTDLCVGISSRAGRLVDANRLFLEASVALEKAMEDPVSPIIAFKSNLEKYRTFIKKRESPA